jgi:predicted short-subunit dehydrogenase-like oxidoreductase (DUF2520 family)
VQDRLSTAVGLIGAGRLGPALAAGLRQADYDVRAIASARIESAQSLAATLGEDVRATSDPDDVLALCDLVFLTVPDAVIEPLAASLGWESRHLVVHCSGALGLEALVVVSRAGGNPGCLHPLQSFPSRSPQPDRFNGVFCGVERGSALGPFLETIRAETAQPWIRYFAVPRL